MYIISDQPRDITNIKLAGKFRGTDLRWEPEKRTITMVIIRPYQPPLYRVNGVDNVAYTRQQLQLIKKA